MKKVFITGSSGLLGTNLIVELLESGFLVKGLARDPASYEGGVHERLELVKGNILDNLDEHLGGCDWVIHVAGETRQNIPNYAYYHEINVNGTLNVLNAAIRKNIEKFLYVSSANTCGNAGSRNYGTENGKIRFPFTHSFYALSKLEAEEAILKQRDKIEILIANPTFMLGPYDSKPTSGRIILSALNRKIIFHPPGGKNFVHVKDVAKGIIKCLQQGKNGEKYLFAGQNLKFSSFYSRLAELSGKRIYLIKIPGGILKFFGVGGEILFRSGFHSDLNKVNMQSLCIDNYFINDKSRHELQLEYVEVDEAILDALSYFKMKNLS